MQASHISTSLRQTHGTWRRFVPATAGELPKRVFSDRLAFCAFSCCVLAGYAVWFLYFVPDRSVGLTLAIFFAALVSSVAGFAFSAICGAMLFHLTDQTVEAVQIMMICSVAGQAMMVWSLRREIAWRSLTVFLIGAAAGLPLGILILLYARPAAYTQVIGVLLVMYAGYMIARRPLVIR